jgi:AraC-like DNA-binding protein
MREWRRLRSLFVATKQQRVHQGLEDALEWLGRAEETAAVSAFLDAASARRSRIVDDLRAYLEEHIDRASLASAARALGVARRTLQLELAREGANFRAIRDEVRMLGAKARLERSNEKIDHVARALGFRSPRRFYKWFRDQTGSTPGDWRQRPSRD